jgi:inorganic triphosphatase YgiF
MDAVERELKLVPVSDDLLDRLFSLDRLGPFTARSRRRERQHNSFFDTSTRALSRERVGFRCRRVDGQRLATWTIKGEARHVGGVATRAEIELALDADMPPALALDTLRAAARSRGAAVLADAVEAALSAGDLPLARPFLDMETYRRFVDFEAPAEGWHIELALDQVRMIGHAYAEVEIEAELERGDEAALAAARAAIAELGSVRESEGSKLSRGMAHLDSCRCGVATV